MAASRSSLIALLLTCTLTGTPTSHAADAKVLKPMTLTVLSSSAITSVLQGVAPEYEKATGVRLDIKTLTSAPLPPSLQPLHHPAADVVLTEGTNMDSLLYHHQIEKSTRVDLGRSFIALAVREGAPIPEISTVASLRRTLLLADSVASSNSPSGVYLSHWLFPKLNLGQGFSHKSKTLKSEPVGNAVARGAAQLGFEQLSKLKSLPGIVIVGLIPDEVQKMVLYSGGVVRGSAHAAEATAVLRFLASSKARKRLIEGGLVPVH